ncbi:MAG: hypothetical protein KGJ62_15265 [Armatimonadetes bacterium]|nr:hypothetical protein [Armatimonadota bacterium]MDE2207531.1 hypothetical protein [Armatimonadota bacterium]
MSTGEDPYRARVLALARSGPDGLLAEAPPLVADPWIDPGAIEQLASAVPIPAALRFEHPLLERVVRIGLAHITLVPENSMTAEETVSAVDALTRWGMVAPAEALFGSWLRRHVGRPGSALPAPSTAGAYGQLLTAAYRLMSRGGSAVWLSANRARLDQFATQLQRLVHAQGKPALIRSAQHVGSSTVSGFWLHDNAWAARGLSDWAHVVRNHRGAIPAAERLRSDAGFLMLHVTDAASSAWNRREPFWWLTPAVDALPVLAPDATHGGLRESEATSRTNTTYWPLLLSSGVLSPALMARLVHARLNGGGQLLGLSRSGNGLESGAFSDYLDGLWRLGLTDDYRYSLWGHICFMQAEGHMTAYDAVTEPACRPAGAFSLVAQLAPVRAIARLAAGRYRAAR